jgi:hypothetical protein
MNWIHLTQVIIDWWSHPLLPGRWGEAHHLKHPHTHRSDPPTNEHQTQVAYTQNVGIHLSIYLFIYLSIYLSIYLFIYLSIYQVVR